MTNDIHVYPLNDKKPHKLEGVDCECKPKVEVVGANLIITHNAFDHRAIMEQLREEKMPGM